jgi:hypothetical protein
VRFLLQVDFPLSFFAAGGLGAGRVFLSGVTGLGDTAAGCRRFLVVRAFMAAGVTRVGAANGRRI